MLIKVHTAYVRCTCGESYWFVDNYIGARKTACCGSCRKKYTDLMAELGLDQEKKARERKERMEARDRKRVRRERLDRLRDLAGRFEKSIAVLEETMTTDYTELDACPNCLARLPRGAKTCPACMLNKNDLSGFLGLTDSGLNWMNMLLLARSELLQRLTSTLDGTGFDAKRRTVLILAVLLALAAGFVAYRGGGWLMALPAFIVTFLILWSAGIRVLRSLVRQPLQSLLESIFRSDPHGHTHYFASLQSIAQVWKDIPAKKLGELLTAMEGRLNVDVGLKIKLTKSHHALSQVREAYFAIFPALRQHLQF